MKYLLLSLLVATLAACDSDSGDLDLNQLVNPITLGPQIDRMGRPAINTALNNTFAQDAARGAAEDRYNRTANSNAASFNAEFAANLAIYDALAEQQNNQSCGENPLTNRASANPNDGLATGAQRYNFIASVLADDQLYVNASTSGGSENAECNQYLAAELTVIGVAGLGADCGGRTPLQDVIQTTYSAVAIGGVTGVDDGISSDNVNQSASVFPFLATPL